MYTPIIYPYKMSSVSGRVLARALNTRRVYPNRRYRPRPDHMIINWGNSQWPNWDCADNHPQIRPKWVNEPTCTQIAADKYRCLYVLKNSVRAVPFTVHIDKAKEWNSSVVVRHSLFGRGGAGIEVVSRGDELPAAPLYTKYLGRRAEYRVHVMNGDPFLTQKRGHPSGASDINWQVRSCENGWIMRRDFADSPSLLASVVEEALKAVAALGLDFGAVDIAIPSSDGLPYVLEVNTAPGLVGSTIEDYATAFRTHYNLRS